MFAPLKKSEIVDIVRLQFNGVKKMLENNGIAIEVTDKAVQWLADAGYDPQFRRSSRKNGLFNVHC